MPFCSACGNDVKETAEICVKCGSRVKEEAAPVREQVIYANNQRSKRLPMMPDGRIVSSEKSVALAVILSIFIPGAGTMYAGKIGRGILFLILSWGLLFLVIGIIFWIWAIYDAYVLTKHNNFVWYDYVNNQ